MGTAAPLSGGVDTGSIADVPRHQVPRQDVLLPREKSAFRKVDMETEDSNEGLYHPYFSWGKTFIKRPPNREMCSLRLRCFFAVIRVFAGEFTVRAAVTLVDREAVRFLTTMER
jgi:hypothetical protein